MVVVREETVPVDTGCDDQSKRSDLIDSGSGDMGGRTGVGLPTTLSLSESDESIP